MKTIGREQESRMAGCIQRIGIIICHHWSYHDDSHSGGFRDSQWDLYNDVFLSHAIYVLFVRKNFWHVWREISKKK